MADISIVPSFHRTRIAPTPSGFLHLGNVLSFILTATLAEKHGIPILLRIDDMDQQRVRQEYVQDIFDTLQFLGLSWHEGPQNAEEFEKTYAQRHRMIHYNQLLETLQSRHLLFACDCSRSMLGKEAYTCQCLYKKLPLDADGVSWRLITDPEMPVQVIENGRIHTTTLPAIQHYFVIRKKDGYPAYQLCSLADDLYFGVDLIVRGIDLWPSTLAQHYLAQACDHPSFSKAVFVHHALLNESAGRKLSKSAGALSVRHLRATGKTPAQIFTLIAGMAGLSGSVSTWQELGTRLLNAHSGFKTAESSSPLL